MVSRRRKRNDSFSFWPPFVDVLFTFILFLFFYILVEFFANSEIFILMDLQKRQKAVLVAMKERFQDEFKKQLIRSRTDGDLQRFSFSNQILFDSGSDRLKEEGQGLIANFFDFLLPQENNFARVQVVGHTDRVKIKSKFIDNWSLSASRAVSVVRYAELRQFPPKKLSATGYGRHQPIASNDTAEGRQLNRRIEVIIIYHRRTKFF